MITLKDIVSSGFVELPLPIRPLSQQFKCAAELRLSGSIQIEDDLFDDVDSAMSSVLANESFSSSSNGWQFWGWYCTTRKAWTPLEHLRAKIESQNTQNTIRTSESHPLRIDRVNINGFSGSLGLTFCPGKHSDGIYGGRWERDLHQDFQAIENWGAQVLITLMEACEFDLLDVGNFQHEVKQYSFDWLHTPIRDMDIPSKQFEQEWQNVFPGLKNKIEQGKHIVLHCRGGLGRTGLIAARVLVDLGYSPESAVSTVRNAREHTIETFAQEEYVLTQAWLST